MPNIRILAQAVLKIFYSQGFSIAIVAESKKGHNFATLGPTEKKKKIRVRLFFVLMQHINFQVPNSSGSLDTEGT